MVVEAVQALHMQGNAARTAHPSAPVKVPNHPHPAIQTPHPTINMAWVAVAQQIDTNQLHMQNFAYHPHLKAGVLPSLLRKGLEEMRDHLA